MPPSENSCLFLLSRINYCELQ